MILRADAAQLGFEGNPPEISMYRSLLEEHGFHRQRDGAWGIRRPENAFSGRYGQRSRSFFATRKLAAGR